MANVWRLLSFLVSNRYICNNSSVAGRTGTFYIEGVVFTYRNKSALLYMSEIKRLANNFATKFKSINQCDQQSWPETCFETVYSDF